jgi:uridine phosphorylase
LPQATGLGDGDFVGVFQKVMNRPSERDDCLIRPKKTRKDPHVGPDALLILTPDDFSHLMKLHHEREVACYDMGFFKVCQVGGNAGRALTMCGPFIGAPQAVMGMEKLIALGAKDIWVLGWCGSLQPELRIGHFVIPTSAISEEGTSRHYPLPQSKPHTNQALNRILTTTLQNRNQLYSMGEVWTTDAPYRETCAKVKAYQEQNVLAVEMEMSALMTVALYRSARLAALLVVSDELFDLKWHAGFRDPGFKAKRHLAAQVLFGLLESHE